MHTLLSTFTTRQGKSAEWLAGWGRGIGARRVSLLGIATVETLKSALTSPEEWGPHGGLRERLGASGGGGALRVPHSQTEKRRWVSRC